jgi:geranylgeranyl pyrophosphate synthase
MLSVDHMRTFVLHENIERLLIEVEVLMFEALRLDTGFSTSGQADARSASAYHLRSGGQRVRARLALFCGLALELPVNDSLCIATCAELLHNASLIHDDIHDRDGFRRDQQAVWSRYGDNLAICSGDYLLSTAYSVLCNISQPLVLSSMLALVHERISVAIDGQCADLRMRVDQADGISHYVKVAKAKSGALLSLPLELALLASGQKDAMSLAKTACENFAVSYQIFDDLQDTKIDGEVDSIKTNKSKNLNIVFILDYVNSLTKKNNRVTTDVLARDLGLQHLALCETDASQMPRGTGALLLELTAKLRHKIENYSYTECC